VFYCLVAGMIRTLRDLSMFKYPIGSLSRSGVCQVRD
jgi:hypothetical protein